MFLIYFPTLIFLLAVNKYISFPSSLECTTITVFLTKELWVMKIWNLLYWFRAHFSKHTSTYIYMSIACTQMPFFLLMVFYLVQEMLNVTAILVYGFFCSLTRLILCFQHICERQAVQQSSKIISSLQTFAAGIETKNSLGSTALRDLISCHSFSCI